MKAHSTVEQFEKMVLVLKNSIEKRGKTSIADIQQWIDGNYSKSKRFAYQLREAGYLKSDNAKPLGFTATDKAKELFKVAL
ncbi:hypothetical protein L291_3967 [Acinetobacter guillouiae MSP4-18]|jgi:hypothetical protein|uniref:hypothetical protein n=1 Tax=Acinetobacter TaxID=469 RepID=UPI0002CF5BF6|nr:MULTISPECIES: hypothetical protein [Acinetobacter]ENU57355.1 hypothetical protein F981_03583 [Acinetobacter guillouiae CIP 63.46]EPH30808.1 hypothetical protein L291_3967 [Acinetobacter guillouiae MSP4-18]KAB0624925.1 hypothetical protein F7P82_17010 [Acinetobacter guillouiae]KQW88177.1 hypothetical protein ASC84_12430 [Acinetobacter sp. Root1280]